MKTQNFKFIIIGFLLSLPVAINAQIAYGEIRGIIKNTNLEAVPYATVKILQGSQLIGGAQTDENGRYKYKPLIAGFYEMIVTDPGHATQQINKILVNQGEPTYLDVKLSVNTLSTIVVVAKPIDYTKSGVDIDMYKYKSVSGEEIRQNAGATPGDITSAVVAITADVVEAKDGLHFRGARTGASSNYVDGVRTYGETLIPGCAIENLTVFTGGVPACYGDLTSGMVMITTKSYFSGIREKNMRNAAYREQREEDKRLKQEKEEEERRKKEIEAEKEKEKLEKEEKK